jgi:signal transduction histidine kinase
LARANAQLTHYATTLEQLATSRERNRLARELHDTLAHTLSGMAVQLEAAKTLWDMDPAQARDMLDQSLTATRSGLTETRRALQALRAAPLEDLGLVLAVCTLAESVAAQTGATLTWQGPDAARVENLSPDVEQCVYRVAQEALENVARHAGAKHLTVQLTQDKGRLTLQISDDGRGFDLSKASANNHHLGLTGMRERAEMIGGILHVESRLGNGTTIRLMVEDKP